MKVDPYKVRCRLCDEDFIGKSVFIIGGKQIRPSICNPCAIKFDYRGVSRGADRQRLIAEFAREMGITMMDASAIIQMPFKH
jgi:hypothetical protein